MVKLTQSDKLNKRHDSMQKLQKPKALLEANNTAPTNGQLDEVGFTLEKHKLFYDQKQHFIAEAQAEGSLNEATEKLRNKQLGLLKTDAVQWLRTQTTVGAKKIQKFCKEKQRVDKRRKRATRKPSSKLNSLMTWYRQRVHGAPLYSDEVSQKY